MKKLAQGFNNAAQDLNPGSRSRVSIALPLSHSALQVAARSFETQQEAQCHHAKACSYLKFLYQFKFVYFLF